MTRREWLAMISAAPLLKAAPGPEPSAGAPSGPVSIARCASYDEDVTAKLATLFTQLGGIDSLVRNKTVTVKLNMTGSPGIRFQGQPPGVTHYTHPKLVGAAAYLLGRAGARRIRTIHYPVENVALHFPNSTSAHAHHAGKRRKIPGSIPNRGRRGRGPRQSPGLRHHQAGAIV